MTCGWKLVNSSDFEIGMQANRCGCPADIIILRPRRKTDLNLCHQHLNEYIATWGLHYQVQLVSLLP